MSKQIKPTAGPISKVWISGVERTVYTTAGATMNTKSIFTPVDSHQTNSSLSTAQTLTPPSGANAIMFSPDSQSVKMRLDGSDADASTGFTFAAGDVVTVQFNEGVRFSFIELAASATLQYQWGTI